MSSQETPSNRPPEYIVRADAGEPNLMKIMKMDAAYNHVGRGFSLEYVGPVILQLLA